MNLMAKEKKNRDSFQIKMLKCEYALLLRLKRETLVTSQLQLH